MHWGRLPASSTKPNMEPQEHQSNHNKLTNRCAQAVPHGSRAPSAAGKRSRPHKHGVSRLLSPAVWPETISIRREGQTINGHSCPHARGRHNATTCAGSSHAHGDMPSGSQTRQIDSGRPAEGHSCKQAPRADLWPPSLMHVAAREA